jgi:hypothetical protein
VTERTPQNPCIPSPCGVNAECRERNGAGACSCQPGFYGDPYTGCKRECETNSECPSVKACVGFKCQDPCPGTCGQDAICSVLNHVPTCNCPPGYSGDPFYSCRIIPVTGIDSIYLILLFTFHFTICLFLLTCILYTSNYIILPDNKILHQN